MSDFLLLPPFVAKGLLHACFLNTFVATKASQFAEGFNSFNKFYACALNFPNVYFLRSFLMGWGELFLFLPKI